MTDKSDGIKPANQTAKIIQIKPPKSEYQLVCPDCDRDIWLIHMTDLHPHHESLAELICAVCGYSTKGKLHMGSEHYES